MSGMRSMTPARSAWGLSRRRLRGPRLQLRLRAVGRPERPARLATGTSRSDVKGAQRPGRSQSRALIRALMRGGRA
jgi:hypothetical protein